MPFRETNAQLERFGKKYEIGVLLNIDDKLLGATRRHFRPDFDLVVTAQQVRSYKPDPAHFKECARRIEKRKKNWVHIASGYPTDVVECLKQKVPVIWVNRHGDELESGQKKPTEEVKTFREAHERVLALLEVEVDHLLAAALGDRGVEAALLGERAACPSPP